jgi:hypothetical protein
MEVTNLVSWDFFQAKLEMGELLSMTSLAIDGNYSYASTA